MVVQRSRIIALDWRFARGTAADQRGSAHRGSRNSAASSGALLEESGALQHSVQTPLQLRRSGHHGQPVLIGRKQAEPPHHVFDGDRIGVEEDGLIDLE